MPAASAYKTPSSPARARSVSQPLREGVDDVYRHIGEANSPRNSFQRSNSSHPTVGAHGRRDSNSGPLQAPKTGRTRSGSFVTVTEVGGYEPDNVNDRLGIMNHNAAWVNAPGEYRRDICLSGDSAASRALSVDPTRLWR